MKKLKQCWEEGELIHHVVGTDTSANPGIWRNPIANS